MGGLCVFLVTHLRLSVPVRADLTAFSFPLTGAPAFVHTDVCKVLEIANPWNAAARLDADEKGLRTVETPGGPQEVTVITESGLYSLILTSRKPEAKAFKRWVTGTVLPAIRKDGGYVMGEEKVRTG
ncbi:MAG: hypothetical protein B7Z45_05375 [Azorhizobium sp. 12-66-6]|nr:MAG: hypothetical protein B7Z45_05375 [Azorhizobium sp. 12-66-6]